MPILQRFVKGKEPADSDFKQQRLPAWQPQLTTRNVLPIFFFLGIVFIPVGIVLLYFSDEVQEFVYDYTQCESSSGFKDSPSRGIDGRPTCAHVRSTASFKDCTCSCEFTLDFDFKGKVFMYYSLTNFYQNHRRYAKSRDDSQLVGRLRPKPSSDCNPFAYADDSRPIAPCGAIANSMFNDELTLQNKEQKGCIGDVPLLKTGIAWNFDKKNKFRNPSGDLKTAFENFSKPMAWKKEIYELDTDPDNNGFQNEDFIVWMRTAALPTFRKLYRRIDHSQECYKDGLKRGKYVLNVNYNYDVKAFGGSKRMILSTTSPFGGKNPFLGIAYIATGCIFLVVGIILLYIHAKYDRSVSVTSEMM